jgi:hypothetical protein
MVTADDPNRIRLLSARQVKALFPDARLWREQFGRLTKSLVAIRD